MRVALIQPKIPDGNYLPSLGLLYIASILGSRGFQVKVFDENYKANFLKDLFLYDPDTVGFTCVTASINGCLRMASETKKSINAKIVFGGPHPTALPEKTVINESVDFVIVGEGEYPMLMLCEAIKEGKDERDFKDIPNLYYKSNGVVEKTRDTKFLTGEKLDALPYPAFHLLDLEYVFKNSRHGLFSMGKRILTIMTSRGCPQVCTFCCRIMGSHIRERSVSNVLEEIIFMKETYGIDELYIEDDNFCHNKKRALEILDEIIKSNLGIYIKFANGLRADTVDKELLGKIKRAGGYWVGFGIESGSKKVLTLMKKNLDLGVTKQNVEIAKSTGLFVGSNLIVGYPGENEDDLKESLRYFKGLGLDSCAIVNLIPFPKTPVYELCKKGGYLTKKAENYDNFYFRIFSPNVLISTPYLTGKEIRKHVRLFYLKFYLRPLRIYRLFKVFFKRFISEG